MLTVCKYESQASYVHVLVLVAVNAYNLFILWNDTLIYLSFSTRALKSS